MLQAIRDHAQGWIAWVIVGLIIVTFALFGIEQYAKGNKTVVVAEVNGEEIIATDFLTLYNRQKNRLQQQFGELYDQVVKDEMLRDQVLEALIQSEVMKQWAKANNMMISDAQLAATIHNADVFFKDGKFDEETYQSVLLRNGLNVARFEYEQRQFLAEQQNTQLTEASNFSISFLESQLAALQFQKRTVNYLQIAKAPFVEAAEVTDQQVTDYYQANKADFIVPQKVKVDYIELSQAEIAQGIKISDEILQSYYEENKAQYIEPEQRQASHILIRMEAETPEAEQQAKAKIESVQKDLAAGKPFADLAKAFSQDPGSAANGGDLGLFQQGMMVPEFDQAVFSMKEGEVSQPVKTDFGYHIIKLTKILPKKQQSFVEVKKEVETQYRNQQAEKLYFEQLEQLNTLVYEQADSLQPAADALGLAIKTSEAFSQQGGAGIAEQDKVVKAAFADDVFKNGLNSASIELSPTHSVVIRLNQVIDPRQKSLEEVSEKIIEQFKSTQGAKSARLKAEALLKEVESGKALDSLATEAINYRQIGQVLRQNNQLLPQLTEELFKMPKPVNDKPSYQIVQLMNGDAVILELSKFEAGQLPTGNQALEQEVKKTVKQLMGGAESHARLQAMVDSADIVKKPVYKTIK